MEERVPETFESSVPLRPPVTTTTTRKETDVTMATKVTVPTMSDLYEQKTPQTMWWMQRPDDGSPVHWPLALASLPIVAVLSIPAVAAMLLLLPAAVPLLALAPIFVLASMPWWLHLPLTGKPLIIPLAILCIPVVGFFGIIALALMPMMLLVLVPIFTLIPWVILMTLPLLACFSCIGFPGLSYIGVPMWLSIRWTWPFPDFTQILVKFRAAKKEVLSKA